MNKLTSVDDVSLTRVLGGAALTPPAGAVPGLNGTFTLRFGQAGVPASGSMAARAAEQGRQLYNQGFNVTRPIVPGTGTPGMLDNMFILTPRG